MRAADFVVAKAGGLIVTESLAAGLPLLFIDMIPGQETGNADYAVAGGAAEIAADPVAALEIVYHWLADGGSLLARAAAARESPGQAASGLRHNRTGYGRSPLEARSDAIWRSPWPRSRSFSGSSGKPTRNEALGAMGNSLPASTLLPILTASDP